MKYNGVSINDQWAKTTGFKGFARAMAMHGLTDTETKEAYYLITGKTPGYDDKRRNREVESPKHGSGSTQRVSGDSGRVTGL